MRVAVGSALALLLAFAACVPAPSGADAGDAMSLDVHAADSSDVVSPPPDTSPLWTADCDPLMETQCGLPWPSNLYLVADSSRATGYTLRFGAHSLPAGHTGTATDPAPFARMDGYGLGVPIMVLFPNIDVHALPGEDHIDQSLAADAPVLLYEVHGATLTRVPYFAELDRRETSPSRATLFVRPAVILNEATRYIVAFRNLVDTAGAVIMPSRAFQLLRDGQTADQPLLAPRQARFSDMFALLESAGIARGSLTLAWDFNTASHDALHGRLLHMRDDALASVGAHGPALNVTQVTEFAPTADGTGRPVDPYIGLELHGTFTVPSYLQPRASGGSQSVQLNLDANGVPMANGTRAPEFWIRVPHTAIQHPTVPHGLMQYGHGLLNLGSEIREVYLGKMASLDHLILFSTNMYGLSYHELSWATDAATDINNFIAIADALHQGELEYVLLARAVRDRLAMTTEITSRNVTVDPTRMYYSGNSLGGIMGAAYMAISPDVHRGHLGVPGNNFSLMLARSVDFTTFFLVLRTSYPGSARQNIAIAALQALWDGTDAVSYLRHITAEPFVSGDTRNVVMIPARGDGQVAVVTNEILARTDIGIPLMANYDNQRTPWNCPQQAYPRTGSGIVLYEFGTPWPPPGDEPPDTMMFPDPHELPRSQDPHIEQVTHFFDTGEIEDVCHGLGCHFTCDAMQMNCVVN